MKIELSGYYTLTVNLKKFGLGNKKILEPAMMVSFERGFEFYIMNELGKNKKINIPGG